MKIENRCGLLFTSVEITYRGKTKVVSDYSFLMIRNVFNFLPGAVIIFPFA